MRYGYWLAVAALVAGAGSLVAADYPATIDATVGGKAVKMTLTGTAMRTKFIVNVYAIGSYAEAGAGARSADALAAADCAKRLHLVMQRDVSGKDMAEAFRAAVRMNHAAPAFDAEVNTLCQYMMGTSLSKGDHVVLTHVPGVGLHCNVAGRADFTIKNVRFSQAVWEIYLGRNNLGDAIKRGLTSRM
jgi:Chalcone isomerase-like